MAVGFRSLSATTYAGRTNTTITAPSGIQDGDVLLLFFVIGASGTPPTATLPGGFQLFSGFPATVGIDGFNVATRVAWKVAASESGNYTVSHNSASSQGAIYCTQGGATETPAVTNNNGSGTTSTATGLTTTGADALIIFWDHNWQLYGGASPPGGSTPTFTERLDLSSSLMYLADGILASAGATGNKSHGNNNAVAADPWRAVLIAIEDTPAPSGGARRLIGPRFRLIGRGGLTG